MKKSILFIVQNLPIPQDRRVWMEAKTMLKNGYFVSTISPGNKDQKKYELLDGIHIFRYSKPPKSSGYFSYIFEYTYSLIATTCLCVKIYFKRGFGILHIANPPDFLFLIALIFKPFGVKMIWDQHDLMPEMSLVKFKKNKRSIVYKLLQFLEQMSYLTADAHIATCRSGKEVILSRVKDKRKSFIVRSAPDLKIINRGLADQDRILELRKKFKHICCYLGVMGHQDGVDLLLESITRIVCELGRKDIGFVLMGDGDALDDLKKIARAHGISEKVIFTGWADAKEISTYFWASDLALMPEPKNDYTDNSLHNKVLEYMSAGLPIVAYDLKEARNSAGDAAVYATGNNMSSFAQNIISLLDDQEARVRMSKIGRYKIKNDFNWEKSEKNLLAAYNSIIAKSAI